jgi:hypothetical protein
VRSEVKDRFYRVYTYQDVDRVPDPEFGYWLETIRRWLSEGLPLELTPEETNECLLEKLDSILRFERQVCLAVVHAVNMAMCSAVE